MLLGEGVSNSIMIPIKIQCGCGQRYAFDVEPVQGRMPYAVACPACGVDGTAAANELIAQSVPVEIPIPPPPVRLEATSVAQTVHRPSSASAGPRRPSPVPGQLDRIQAQHE